MTRLKLGAISTVLIAGLAILLVVQRQSLVRLRGDQSALQRQLADLRDAKDQLAETKVDQDELEALRRDKSELLRLRGEVAQLRGRLAQSQNAAANPGDPFTQSVLAAVGRAAQLNGYLERSREKSIPELYFLTETDWLEAAKHAKFDTDVDIRKALSKLRGIAKAKMPMGRALAAYTRANNGEMPTDLRQLKPYFQTPVDDGHNWGGVDPARDDAILDAILERYKIVRTGNASNLSTDAWIVVEKDLPVDPDYDDHIRFGIGRSWSTGP